MKLTEAILLESPIEDREMRDRARRASTSLIDAFRAIGGLSGMTLTRIGYVATQSVLGHPEGIGLIIKDNNRDPSYLGGMDVNKRMLYLFLDINSNIEQQMRSNTVQTTIIHEFVHLFDYERMNVMNPTSHLPNSEYYNDPSETNAYYQEAIDKFERTMSKLSPKAREIHLTRLQNSFEDFERQVNMMASPSFMKWRDDKTKRHFQRRLYRYWDEMVRRA